MATPRSTFNIGLAVAKEGTYSVSPDFLYYWQGGKYIPITTNGTPNLWDRQATIFPEGRAGSRARYNRRPVVGRQWSDGDFGYDFTMDFFPLLAYGAMGSLSSNSVPSTDFSLQENEPITADTSKLLVLTDQPSDGGAILEMYVGGTSAGGWVEVIGQDAEGRSASEVISFSSAGSLYTRTSFSSIAASNITVWSTNDATISINGYQYFEHTVSFNNVNNPTFSIQSFGDPTAGATSIIRLLPGMVVTELSLDTPAEARDGLMTGTVNWEGRPTATCTGASLASVSSVQVWPSWTLSLYRDGVSFDKALDFSFSVGAGNRNYRVASGNQAPQGAVFLGQSVEGSMRILLNSEDEYNRWRSASSNRIYANWQSPYKLNTSHSQQMSASFNQLYFSDVSRGEDADLQILEADFMTIVDSTDGLAKFYFKSNMPPSAYS